jgi:hypothetical protein
MIKAFFWAAYQTCLLTFVSVSQRAASALSPYLSCRLCRPLSLSFSVIQKIMVKNKKIMGPVLFK